jgi:predicted transposase YbfD/YdcC
VIDGSRQDGGGTMEQATAGKALLDHFAALDDPRQQAKVLYPLPEIMLLLLCATLAGADDFVEIAWWGRKKLAFLRRFCPYAHGIPSHDTLGEVIRALDPALFKACFIAWVDGLRESEPDLIAIDGKTSRRTHTRSKGREPLHLVSAWASRQRLVLGQEAVSDKSNEIVAIPRLLERLALSGALVTIDAIGTQRAIAETIRAGGGDYLLALKANWPATFQDIEAFFADPPPGVLDTCQTTDGEHGRIEVRHHAVCHTVGWLFSDRRYPGEPSFPDLAMIGMVEATTERGGKTAHERRYYLSSARLDPKTFARAVRAHWGIENRLHWVLDVVFHDDLARLRTGHGPENMAVVKHMAINLLRAAKPITSLKNRRKLAGWDIEYLDQLIRGAA